MNVKQLVNKLLKISGDVTSIEKALVYSFADKIAVDTNKSQWLKNYLSDIDYSIVDIAIDKGYTLGITVQPLKMSTPDTVKMLDEYGFEQFVLDSDISPAPSNHLSLPETKHELEITGHSRKDIEKVTYKNVAKFHNLKL